MSKTITKKLDGRVCAAKLLAAFRLMDIPAAADGEIRLYARQKVRADLALDAEALARIGIRSAYGTGIGIDVRADGQAELVYDHANESAARLLAGLLPGLTQIGAAEGELQAMLGSGYTMRPHIDAEAGEYGVFLEAGLQTGGGGW